MSAARSGRPGLAPWLATAGVFAAVAALAWLVWDGAAADRAPPPEPQTAIAAPEAPPAAVSAPAGPALAEARDMTAALRAELSRLRWTLAASRRQCLPPPEPPQLAAAEPPPPPPEDPPPPEPEPEPEPPVLVAELAPPHPPPAPTDRPHRPPPPPPPVAVVAADPPPQPQPAATEFDQRITREGGRTGETLVTLIWNNINDLDLHIVCPSGREVYFADPQGCASYLDIDMNASTANLSARPVENIIWPGGLPPGRYRVVVDHYANHGGRDPTPYRVRVKVNGREQVFQGAIRYGERAQMITEFYIN